ncbi:unnamed protein product [Hymenolepis diminuta]|uniref:Uncharacterized protein n=1 Tax=Hymenolepis diminuta TaxID=6216 RepID=A0A564Y993_HYMDI|nr:unnamed protein product [Hymenolepis diminuta]
MDSIKTAKISAIARSIMEQMNLSKPDKDPEDYSKNFGEFHYEPSVGETFTTCKSDCDLYLAYLQPLSPKDLAFEETIEKCKIMFGDNTSPFNLTFKSLSLAIRKGEDIHKYTATVNQMCNV